jgi:protein-disulfide isomerase
MNTARFNDDKTPGKAAVAAILVVVTIIGLGVSYHFFNYNQDPEGLENQLTKSQIDGYINDYIMNNPDVILESMKQYQQRMVSEYQQNVDKNIQKLVSSKLDGQDAPYVGNKNGDQQILFFFDYNCGYCKQSYKELRELLNSNNNLKIVHHHYPIMGELSNEAAKCAIAIYHNYPGVYADFHKKLFEASKVDKATLDNTISKVGLDKTEIEQESHKDWVENKIADNIQEARDISLAGAPGFIIGGELHKGYLKSEEIKQILESKESYTTKSEKTAGSSESEGSESSEGGEQSGSK